MPDFGTPTSVLKLDHTLNKPELEMAIRLFIAAEYEAVQLYMQVAEATDNELAKRVLTKVSDEERVHAGEFLALLKIISPDEEKYYKEGAGEVEAEVTGVKKEKQKDPEDIKREKLKNLFS